MSVRINKDITNAETKLQTEQVTFFSRKKVISFFVIVQIETILSKSIAKIWKDPFNTFVRRGQKI